MPGIIRFGRHCGPGIDPFWTRPDPMSNIIKQLPEEAMFSCLFVCSRRFVPVGLDTCIRFGAVATKKLKSPSKYAE